ncbi:MAG: hypothetical protein WC513_08115, partial [Bacteroidales bacterium]
EGIGIDPVTGTWTGSAASFFLNGFNYNFSGAISTDWRNYAGVVTNTGRQDLAAQSDKQGLVALGGLDLTAGEKFSFNDKGNLETRHDGYWAKTTDRSYTALLQDAKGKKALTELVGDVEWDKEGKLTKGENSFAKLMTEAENSVWKNITGRVLEKGALNITTEAGTYSIFTSPSEKQDKITTDGEEGLPTARPKVEGIGIDPVTGTWTGSAASFFLNGFNYNFSGAISTDWRNYAGVALSKGEVDIGGTKLIFTDSSLLFRYDEKGQLTEGINKLSDGTIREYKTVDGKKQIVETLDTGITKTYIIDKDGNLAEPVTIAGEVNGRKIKGGRSIYGGILEITFEDGGIPQLITADGKLIEGLKLEGYDLKTIHSGLQPVDINKLLAQTPGLEKYKGILEALKKSEAPDLKPFDKDIDSFILFLINNNLDLADKVDLFHPEKGKANCVIAALRYAMLSEAFGRKPKEVVFLPEHMRPIDTELTIQTVSNDSTPAEKITAYETFYKKSAKDIMVTVINEKGEVVDIALNEFIGNENRFHGFNPFAAYKIEQAKAASEIGNHDYAHALVKEALSIDPNLQKVKEVAELSGILNAYQENKGKGATLVVERDFTGKLYFRLTGGTEARTFASSSPLVDAPLDAYAPYGAHFERAKEGSLGLYRQIDGENYEVLAGIKTKSGRQFLLVKQQENAQMKERGLQFAPFFIDENGEMLKKDYPEMQKEVSITGSLLGNLNLLIKADGTVTQYIQAEDGRRFELTFHMGGYRAFKSKEGEIIFFDSKDNPVDFKDFKNTPEFKRIYEAVAPLLRELQGFVSGKEAHYSQQERVNAELRSNRIANGELNEDGTAAGWGRWLTTGWFYTYDDDIITEAANLNDPATTEAFTQLKDSVNLAGAALEKGDVLSFVNLIDKAKGILSEHFIIEDARVNPSTQQKQDLQELNNAADEARNAIYRGYAPVIPHFKEILQEVRRDNPGKSEKEIKEIYFKLTKELAAESQLARKQRDIDFNNAEERYPLLSRYVIQKAVAEKHQELADKVKEAHEEIAAEKWNEGKWRVWGHSLIHSKGDSDWAREVYRLQYDRMTGKWTIREFSSQESELVKKAYNAAGDTRLGPHPLTVPLGQIIEEAKGAKPNLNPADFRQILTERLVEGGWDRTNAQDFAYSLVSIDDATFKAKTPIKIGGGAVLVAGGVVLCKTGIGAPLGVYAVKVGTSLVIIGSVAETYSLVSAGAYAYNYNSVYGELPTGFRLVEHFGDAQPTGLVVGTAVAGGYLLSTAIPSLGVSSYAQNLGRLITLGRVSSPFVNTAIGYGTVLAADTGLAALEMYHPLYENIGGVSAITGALLTPGRGILSAFGSTRAAEVNNQEMRLAEGFLRNTYGGNYWGPVALGGLTALRAYAQAVSGSYLVQFVTPKGFTETVEGIKQMFMAISEGSAATWDRWDIAKVTGSFIGGYAGFRGVGRVPGMAGEFGSALNNTGRLGKLFDVTARGISSIAKGTPGVYAGGVGLSLLLPVLKGQGFSLTPLHQIAQDTDLMWRTSIGFSIVGNLVKPAFNYAKTNSLGSQIVLSTSAGGLALGTDYLVSKIHKEDYSLGRGLLVFGTASAAAFGLARFAGANSISAIPESLRYPLGAGVSSLVAGLTGNLSTKGSYDFLDAAIQFGLPSLVSYVAVKSANMKEANINTPDAGQAPVFWRNVLNRVDPIHRWNLVGESLKPTRGFNLRGTVPAGLLAADLVIQNTNISAETKHILNLAFITAAATHIGFGLRGESGSSSGFGAFVRRMFNEAANGKVNLKSPNYWGIASNAGAAISGTAFYLLNDTDDKQKPAWFKGLSESTRGTLGLMALIPFLAGIGGYREVVSNLKRPIWTDNILRKGKLYKEGAKPGDFIPVESKFFETHPNLYKAAYIAGNRGLYWINALGVTFGGPYAIERITGQEYDKSGNWKTAHTIASLGLIGLGIMGPGMKPTFENLGRTFNQLISKETVGGKRGASIFTYELAKTAFPTIPALTIGMAGFPDIQNYIYSMHDSLWTNLLKSAFGFNDFKIQYQQITGKEWDGTKSYFEAQREMTLMQISEAINKLDKSKPGWESQLKDLEARKTYYSNLTTKDMHWLTGKFRWLLRTETGFEGLKVGLWFGPSLYFIRPLLETGLRRMPISGEIQGFMGEGLGQRGMGDALFPEIRLPGTGVFSRVVNVLTRPLYMIQGLTMEEQVRENLFSAVFNPLIARAGYQFDGDARSRRFAIEQQVLENFQEANDSTGRNTGNISQRVLRGLVGGRFSIAEIIPVVGAGGTPAISAVDFNSNVKSSNTAQALSGLGALPLGSRVIVEVPESNSSTFLPAGRYSFEVTNQEEWSRPLNVYARRIEYTQELNSGHGRPVQDFVKIARGGQGSGVSDIDKQAARYVLAEQLPPNVVAKLLHPTSAGMLTLRDGANAESIHISSLALQLTERMAFDQNFENDVRSAYGSVANVTPIQTAASFGRRNVDILASSGNERTAEQAYLLGNQQNISQPRYYVQENGRTIEVGLQGGKFTDARGNIYAGERVTQIHSVQGMRAAVSKQTGNLQAGRGAGGIGEQGQNIVYVDASERIDLANPFTNQVVLHERNELAREVRMGQKLQERIGTISEETPAQRLARSTQALPAMQNAHENAPSLDKGIHIVVHENQSLPINTIFTPELTTGPPSQHQPLPLLIAASGGHTSVAAPVVSPSTPSKYLLTKKQKLEQELARINLDLQLAQVEAIRTGEPSAELYTLAMRQQGVERDLAYTTGLAKYGAGINNRWDRIRFALSSGRRNEVRARVIEDIYGSKEKLEKRISDLQAERERAAKLSDEDFARQHGFSSDGQQLTDETRRTITWLRDMTNQGLDSQIDELQIYGGKFNLRAHFYYAEKDRKQAQAGFMASAMEAGLKPQDVGLAAWPEFTQDIRQKNRGVYQSGDKVIEVIPTANSDQRRGAIENLAGLMPGRHIVGNNGNIFLLSRVVKGKEYLPFQERASALARAQRQLLGWSLDRLQKLTGVSPIISDEQKKVLAIVVEGERVIAEAARILSSDGSLDVKDARYFIFHPGNKSLKFRLPEGVSLPQESTILTEQELRVLQQGISANTEELNRERFEAAWAKLTRFIEATAQGSLPVPEAKQVSSWNDISHQEAINAVRTQLSQLHQGINPKQQQQELERLISIDAGSAQNKAEALRRIQHINTLLAAEGKEPQNLAEGISYFDKQAYDELEAVKKQIDEGVKDPKWSDAGHVGRRQQNGIVEFFALRDNPKASSVWSEEIEKAIGRARSIVRTRLVKERDRLLKTQLAVPADTHAAVLANADEILLPAELTGALKLKDGENLWDEMNQQQRKQLIRRIRHSVESILRASEKARGELRKEIESSRQMLKAMKAVEAIKEEVLALASGKKDIRDSQYFVTRNAGRGLKFRYPANGVVGTSAPEALTAHELMVLRKGASENTSPQNRKVYQDALRKIYRYAGNTLEEEVAKVRAYMDAQVARGVPQDKMVWPNGKAELEYGKKVKQKRSTLKAAGYDEESLLQYVVVTQRSFLQNEMELLRQLTISRSEPGALAKASRAIDTVKNKQDTAEKQQREVQNLDNQRKNLAGQSRKQREQIQDRQKVLEDALRAVLMVLADKPADESLSAPLDLSGSATLFEKEVSRQLQADLDENAVEQAPRDSQRVRVIRAILAGEEDASRTFEREQKILREAREKITKRLEQERSQLEQELTKTKDEVAKELQAEQAKAEQKVAELADKMHQAYQQAQAEGREIKLPEYAFNVPYRTPEAKEEPLPVPVEIQGETAGKIDIESVKQEVRKLDKESLSGFERIVVDGSLNSQPFKREKAAEGDKQVLRVNPAYMRVMPGILKAGLNGKDGVVSQAVELLPYLIKANGDLQGTDLGRIAKGLVNSDATRRERTQLARRLINSLEQANNGTGQKLGGARRLWEARKLAWDVEQTVRSNEFQPRINSQGRLLLSDESSPYADVVVPLVRLVERLPQLPEDALMSVVNGRHISRLMNSTSQPAATPKVASSHGKPKPPLSTVSFLGVAWIEYAVKLAALNLGWGGNGAGGGVSGRGTGLGRGGNIGKGKGGSAAQVRRPEILKQALQTVVGQETREVNRTAQVPQVPANGDSNPANRNPQSNALPPVTPLLPNNGLGGVGTFGAVVNTHSSTTGLSPSSILPNPDISTGFTGPNDAQRLMNAFGVQLLGQAGGIRPAAVVLPTTGSGLKEAGENIAGSTSVATEVGSETGVMASNSLTGGAQGTPEEKGVRAQGSGSATRQTTGRTDRARGVAVRTGSGNGIDGSGGVSGGKTILPKPVETGLTASSYNQVPPQNTKGNHTARSPPAARLRNLITIALIGIIGVVSCGCRSLSRERNPNYDPNQPHSLQNSPLTPEARLKHLQPILEKLDKERKKTSATPVQRRGVGVNGQVNSFGFTA